MLTISQQDMEKEMKKTMTVVLWNHYNGLGRLNSFFSCKQEDIILCNGSPAYLTE